MTSTRRNFIHLTLLITIFLESCTGVTVYKLSKPEPKINYIDLSSQFKTSTFFIKEMREIENDFDTKNVKSKISYYLRSKGYTVLPELKPPFPRFVVFFTWKINKKSIDSTIPIYKPGKTTYSSGNISSYSGDNYSYNGTSTESGTIDYIPYTECIYTANLIILIEEIENHMSDIKCRSVWSTSTFFSGTEASDINKAIDYLIVAAFDRFGLSIEGDADKYEFNGTEKEIKSLKEYNKFLTKINNRKLNQ